MNKKLMLGSFLLLSACALSGKKEEVKETEVSLSADRSHLDRLRKEIPEETRRENDELALILQTINKNSGYDEDPAKIRGRFGKLMREKRSASDRTFRKKREEFTQASKVKRDEFLNALKKERSNYLARSAKAASSDRQAFFSSQDQKRQAYFADEADRRKSFESSLGDERRNFEDSAREITNKFNEEIRAYSTAYFDRKKAEALKKKVESKAAPGLTAEDLSEAERAQLEEFKRIPKGPGTPLGPSGQ